MAKLVPAALVLPRLKILYFPVTKAACTTLKWALAEAEGNAGPAPLKLLRKLPHWLANGVEMAKLFLMAPIRSERFQPAVR